jgi:hypothetical protein
MVPPKLPKTASELLEANPKAIVHLRSQQLDRKRLGLIFGSGASKDLNFPDWQTLVGRLARHHHVKGQVLVRKFFSQPKKSTGKPHATKSLSSITQLLFGLYKRIAIERKGLQEPLSFLEDQSIRTGWIELIHSMLYEKVDPTRREQAIKRHSYINAFLKIIKTSPMTVNYNFDDTLEKLLMFNRDSEEIVTTRGYETTYRPNSQFQKENGVIYHPNGFLPSIFTDGASPELIFSDESFQDQLISAASGQYIQLSNFIFRNTCLLIGISLDDSTLQHLLRQSAVSNPGHIHYLVHFVASDNEYDQSTLQAIFDSNFSCYNLYTLFLDRSGIRALGELISLAEDAFNVQYTGIQRKFTYYLIGSVGVGKSTAISNFRNLITYDEWVDERRPDMAIPEKRIPPSKKKKQVAEINRWTAEQFRKKNLALAKKQTGIHLVDRCPLDPLTFGTKSERRAKADDLLKTITDKQSHPIEKGHLIYLEGDTGDIQQRNTYKHKYWTPNEIEDLIDKIDAIYKKTPRTNICTRGRSVFQVSREIAKVIFLDPYNDVNLEAELLAHASGTKK